MFTSFLGFLMHPAFWRTDFSKLFVSSKFSPLFMEKDSQGLGLDAPEDEISQGSTRKPQMEHWMINLLKSYSNLNKTLLNLGTTEKITLTFERNLKMCQI